MSRMEWTGNFLMTKPMCSDCELIKDMLKAHPAKVSVRVMTIGETDSMALCALAEALDKPVPYVIVNEDEGEPIVFDTLRSIEQFLWGEPMLKCVFIYAEKTCQKKCDGYATGCPDYRNYDMRYDEYENSPHTSYGGG